MSKKDLIGLKASEPLIKKVEETVMSIDKRAKAIKEVAKVNKQLTMKIIILSEKLSKEEKKQVKDAMMLFFKKEYGI